jgi:myo-inositol 2-dehydrogenase/D-chiro-inositol 1-dehydrogenase
MGARSDSRPLGLAIVGCGFIGAIHAANANLLDGVQLRAACDVRGDTAERFALRHGIESWTTSLDELLAREDVDALAVCTHPPVRAEIAVRAAAAGKHLFLEKPMAATLEDGEAIVRAADAAGVVVGVDFKFRAAPAVREALAVVPAAVLVLAQAAMEPLPADSPHMDAAQGGGILENLGSHIFDLAFVLTASEPVWITCAGLTRDERPVACDVATGVIGHASGALTSYSVGDIGLAGYASKWLLQSFDGARSATITNHGRDLYVDTEPAPRVADSETETHAVGTLASLAAFVQAATDAGRDGLRAVALVCAAQESMRSGGARVEVAELHAGTPQ